MAVRGLNHAVLYVRDVARTIDFYENALGFRVITQMQGRAAFLQAEGSTNDHDLGLFAIGANAGDSGAGRSTGCARSDPGPGPSRRCSRPAR